MNFSAKLHTVLKKMPVGSSVSVADVIRMAPEFKSERANVSKRLTHFCDSLTWLSRDGLVKLGWRGRSMRTYTIQQSLHDAEVSTHAGWKRTEKTRYTPAQLGNVVSTHLDTKTNEYVVTVRIKA